MRTGNEDWMGPWCTQIDDACMQSEDGPSSMHVTWYYLTWPVETRFM